MPTGRKFSKRTGRWEKIQRESVFDYEATDLESGSILLSFFRTFPDLFLDCIESENADFTLSLPQRVMLRAFAHCTSSMITSFRGLGKTYTVILSCMTDGALYPGEVVRYYAPSMKMSAELAAVAFHQIEKNYPPLGAIWRIKSETKENFIIVTDYGSEIAVGAIQGANCSQIAVEEIGQETEPKFDFADFESKVVPTCRMERRVNKKKDVTHLNPHYKFITNASRRINPTFNKYRASIMRNMATKKFGTAFCMDVSWEIGVLCGIRSAQYVEELKSSMTKEDFLRQMCACYTGSVQNPMISDEDLSAARTLKVMESKHCGNPDAIYIIGHDVSYETGTVNAKCASVVLKLTPFDEKQAKVKRDKFKKEVVYVDNYPPPPDPSIQAAKIRALWERFSLDGANPTYISIDSWQYGKSVVQELVKASPDGVNLSTYDHTDDNLCEFEQKDALEVIYPVKAAGRGTRDPDYEIFRYARMEFEQGNIALLTPDVLEGLEQYKRRHGIKSDDADLTILQPYYKTNELCEQIMNLRVVVSGATEKENRVSPAIQRDSWSALKYALWFAAILEGNIARQNARVRSGWQDDLDAFSNNMNYALPSFGGKTNVVNNLLKNRKW